jgi:hypothetical protein
MSGTRMSTFWESAARAWEHAAVGESAVSASDGQAPDAAAVVNATFEEDDKVRSTLSNQLTARARLAAPIAAKASAAFDHFWPSLFTDDDRDPRTYLAPGEDLLTTMDRVVRKGVDGIRADGNQRSLKLHLTDEVKNLITETNGGSGQGTIVLTDLINVLTAKLPGTPSLRDEPALTICAAEKEAKQRLDEIEGNATPPPTSPSHDGSSPNGDHEPALTAEFVAEHVHELVAKMPAPEEQPILTPPDRTDLSLVTQGIQAFELQSGPSDVTSYHDFNGLQIAFEHVWAEVFDERLGQLGRELYETYIDLVEFTGSTTVPLTAVTSIKDIASLMNDARDLGRHAENAIPQTALPQLADALAALRIRLINFLMPIQEQIGNVPAQVASFLQPLESLIYLAQAEDATSLDSSLRSVTRLRRLLEELATILQQKYAFTVFAKDSSNFGIMVTYRQTWTPEHYQVGDLVSTIPLAPKETRRYTSKQVTKKSRTVKELEDNLRANKTDASDTSRVDNEIVKRAENRTNFHMSADGSYGTEAYKIHAATDAGGDDAKFSQDTKKDFHEAVLKSAQEYKHDNRMEVETTSTEETESTTYQEIQNPNDELTVTYLFYELQRTYRVAEKIHQVTPVVLVANEVPAPHQIDDAWLIQHDWILRRVLLDDSFRPALDFLTQSFVGAELNLQILDNNVKEQRQVVDEIRAQVAAQLKVVDKEQRDLSQKMDTQAGLQFAEGILGTVKRVFDPFKLTGDSVTGTKEGMQSVADYAQQTLDRAEREKMRLLDQLGLATTALQVAVDKLSTAMKEHYDKVNEVDRLRVHVKENILYYMQAIWYHEPPDQRYFRVFQVKVPIVEPKSTTTTLHFTGKPTPVDRVFSDNQTMHIEMPVPDVDIKWKPLVEVAELDEVLGYKGNYAIYRLKENNYLTLHMMQNYLEVADEIQIRDPDDFANYTVSDLQEMATCLYQRDKTVYADHKEEIKKMIIDRLISGRAEDDRVIVPTKSLYIEALVGMHPLLENFKLLHRALDVKKAQAETRHAELENVRLAARSLKGNYEDPDIERKILVEGVNSQVAIQPDTN